MPHIRLRAALLAIALSVVHATSALGATLALDPGFGSGGEVETDLGAYDYPVDLAVARSGSIVVAGSSGTPADAGEDPRLGTSDFAVVRYLPDGSLDTSFGSDGRVTTDLGGFDQGRAVAIQSDGRVLVLGDSFAAGTIRLALVRYDADGSLDPSFGDGGILLTHFPGLYSFGTDVVVARGGKIIASGITILDGEGTRMAVARFLADGTIDTAFGGGDGATLLSPYGGESHQSAVRRDGTILLGGNTDDASDIIVGGLTKTGEILTSFGADGVAVVDLGGNDFAEALLVRRDGRILAAGWTGSAEDTDLVLVMLDARGRPDPRFGTDGTVTTDLGGIDQARALATTPDGGILVAGNSNADGTTDFVLVRYLVSGDLDTSFGDDGILRFDLGGDDGAADLAVTAGGVLIAGRTGDPGSGYDFALLRLRRG